MQENMRHAGISECKITNNSLNAKTGMAIFTGHLLFCARKQVHIRLRPA